MSAPSETLLLQVNAINADHPDLRAYVARTSSGRTELRVDRDDDAHLAMLLVQAERLAESGELWNFVEREFQKLGGR